MSDTPGQPHEHDRLSSAGIARREAILTDAIALGGRRRRQRRTRRVAAIALPLLIIVAILPWLLRPHALPIAKEPPKPITTKPTSRSTVAAIPPLFRIEIIADDPTIVARYATNHAPARIERINDDQLFKELAAANLRGGLATIAGHTRLVLTR